jgi:hypothetical protein
LTGATSASACPECGRPLVEVLVRDGSAAVGHRWKSKATIWGRPAIAVAFGPLGDERRGKARGWIAIGDDAMGVVAIGGFARGIVAIGGVAMGGLTAGGLSLGLLLGLGGFATAPFGLALGGCAVGLLAVGGCAFGAAAVGGVAIGWFAAGGSEFGVHPLGLRQGAPSPEAVDLWTMLKPVVGDVARGSISQVIPGTVAATAFLAALASLSFPALFAWWRSERDDARDRIRRGIS